METIKIPEKIRNEVIAQMTTIEDCQAKLAKYAMKKQLAKDKMWDIIGDTIPETRLRDCSVNIENMTLIFKDKDKDMKSTLDGLLSKLFGNSGDELI